MDKENTSHSESANVADYHLIKIIGKGTYSYVYLGLDEKQTEVAVKAIQRPNFQKVDQRYIDQKMIFMNDASVLDRIQGHPNIVKLIATIPQGTVMSPEGEPLDVDYAMVIETLKGGELSYNLQKYGAFGADLAHHYFKQIVGAIGHMHTKGIAHRDLKPWNVMLSNDLADAKVIDFSYSTPLDQAELKAISAHYILKGFLPGTPQFMAPEQTVKDREPLVDDFSKIDVWALAVMLVYMLTLRFPCSETATE